MDTELLKSLFSGDKTGKSFETITNLLRYFGNPQHRLPPVIHITGTNGKGSTTAFLYAALTCAGLRVHRLISPHLCHLTERITLSNRPIQDDQLVGSLKAIARLTKGEISFFSAITATAIQYFSAVQADVVLMEVGIGGTWDSTNVVSSTCTSVITPISMDHQSLLGPTLRDIAKHKSGIMRRGIACVSAPQSIDVADEIHLQAAEKGSILYMANRDWFFQPMGKGMQIQYSAENQDQTFFPHIGLMGQHQITNAAVAAMTLHVQQAVHVSVDAITRGLSSVFWPGRLQRLSVGANKPANGLAMASWHEIWLDGAHNEGGFSVLRDHIQQENWALNPDKPLVVILGMLPRKDPKAFWNHLAPLAESIWVVESWGQKHGTGQAEMLAASDHGPDEKENSWAMPILESINKATYFSDWAALAEYSLSMPPCRFLVCGSLSLIGYLLQQDSMKSR